MKPVAYDAERRIVTVEDDTYTVAKVHEESFVREAVARLRRYDERDLLAWAIENALPAVLEIPEARDVLHDQIAGKPMRKRGQSTKEARRTDAQNKAVFERAWFHHGRGLPIHTSG